MAEKESIKRETVPCGKGTVYNGNAAEIAAESTAKKTDHLNIRNADANRRMVLSLTKAIYETTDAREAQRMTHEGWLIMTLTISDDVVKYHLFRVD